MPNPNTFDEASAATEEMFANEQLSLGDAEEVTPETAPSAGESTPAEGEQTTENTTAEDVTTETPTETAPAESGASTDPVAQAAETAEIAAQVATEKNAQLQQVMAENETLKQQNARLQGTIDEMSKQNTETIVEEALTPPTLDINALAFADEETQRAAMAKFAEDMAAYSRKELMRELSPTLEYAKKGMLEAEKAEVVDTLSKIPELNGIREILPQLDNIIAKTKWLQSEDMPLDEKYINAFALAKGVNAINTPPVQPEPAKEPTTEELMALYNSNPAFQEMIEKQRLEALKPSQQVPPFSASSGAVNAALNIKEKPKTLEEASARTREMFGGM